MSNITTEIPPQGFEIIRDRTGEILADEFLAQFAIHGDADRNPKVFVERITPIGKEEVSFISVLYSRTSYDNNTAVDMKGKNFYNIDVYTSAKSTLTEDGDSKSQKKLSRLLGMVRAILGSPHYIRLGFSPPFIMRTEVLDIEIADPRDDQNSSNMVMGRLVFQVDAPETVEQIQPTDAEGYDTEVKLDETEKGFVYIIDN